MAQNHKEISTPKTKEAFNKMLNDIYRKSTMYQKYKADYQSVLFYENTHTPGELTLQGLESIRNKIQETDYIFSQSDLYHEHILASKSKSPKDKAYDLETLGEKYNLSYNTLKTYGSHFFVVQRVTKNGKSKLSFIKDEEVCRVIALLDLLTGNYSDIVNIFTQK